MNPAIQAQVNAALKSIEEELKRNTVDISTTKIAYGRENTLVAQTDGDFVDLSLKTTRPNEGPVLPRGK